MSRELLPPELGDLVEIHRPMRGDTGWIAVLAVPLSVGLFAALMDPGPSIGGLLFVGLLLPIMFATAEWFLLEHRLHRHGIVFRSLLPGMKTYVVPYSACDPDSFGTVGRRVHDGSDVTQMVSRRYRQCPLTRTNILLDGLDPSIAMAKDRGGEGDLTDISGVFTRDDSFCITLRADESRVSVGPLSVRGRESAGEPDTRQGCGWVSLRRLLTFSSPRGPAAPSPSGPAARR